MFILDLYTVAELSYDIQIDVWQRQFETSIFTFKNKSFRGSLIRLKIRTMFKMKLLIKFITKMKTILIQLNLLFEIRHEELETYVTSSRTKTKNCDVNAWNPNELLYLILTKLDTGNNLYYFSHSLVRIYYTCSDSISFRTHYHEFYRLWKIYNFIYEIRALTILKVKYFFFWVENFFLFLYIYVHGVRILSAWLKFAPNCLNSRIT